MSSGPSTPRDRRTRRGVELTLSDEAHQHLERLASDLDVSRSELVDALILLATATARLRRALER
jgi:hypothetical protein